MVNIKIFDTTLRDGEQTPLVNFSIEDKVKIAQQLEKLGVDVIEGGFAVASPKNFEALKAISRTITKPILCSLARSVKKDIDIAYEAIKEAPNHRIHTFIATSPVHMKYKLKMNEDQVVKHAIEAVTYAKTLVDDVEFSAEDASRSDKDFLVKIFTEVIKAGATTINVPDTVGYMIPSEYGELIKYIKDNTPGIDNVDISVHCHNDLGMATANSLSAVLNGATQIECAINGIGERAGNTALEEVVMSIKTRNDYFKGLKTNIITEQISNTSQLITYLGGINVQPNKAIVGANAFAHEAGIHQHGVLENRETYEIMNPESIGIQSNKIVLGSLSGHHAFVDRLNKLGLDYDESKLDELFKQFKKLADSKKEVHDEDLIILLNGIDDSVKKGTLVLNYKTARENSSSTAEITLSVDGNIVTKKGTGVGTVDALFVAISDIFKGEYPLHKYQLSTVTEDTKALAKVDVTILYKDSLYQGRAISTDIVEASIESYIQAIGGTMK